MNVKIDDLMVPDVVVAHAHTTIESIREKMAQKNIHALPIINSDNEPVGIITSSDLVTDVPPTKTASQVMAKKVYTVPKYSDVHIAARIMRNHHLHHVIVTHEKKVVGIISSFDLLKLVENHRFVMKNPPTESKDKGKQRQ